MNEAMMTVELEKAAYRAIKDDKKSKLYAKVNPSDKFFLAQYHLGTSAALDIIATYNTGKQHDFYNKICTKHSGDNYCEFDRIVLRASDKAYKDLTNS